MHKMEKNVSFTELVDTEVTCQVLESLTAST